MTILRPLDPKRLTGETATALEAINLELGFVPDLMCALAHSPAALGGYLALRAALKGGVLSTSLRERIAMAVARVNGCNSCLVNHRHLARCAGLADDELDAATRFASDDLAAAAALRFADTVIEARGHVDAADFAAVREAGFDDAAIVEIVAAIGANILANLVNNLAHSSEPLASATAAS